MNDIRHAAEYAAVAEHLRRWHEPAFGRPHALSEPEVSPDGSRVLATGSVLERLEGVPSPRVFAIEGDRLAAVGAPTGASRGARFAPDGETFAFLAAPEGTGDFQLHLGAWSTPGMIAPSARVDGTVEYLHWSPDGRKVLLGVAGRGADLAGGQGSGTHTRDEEELPAWHPLVDAGVPDFAWRSLWVYEIATGELRVASPEGLNCWEAAWAGSERIVAITSSAPDEDAWYGASLSLIEPLARTARVLVESPVQLALPAGSPDGRWVSAVEAVCSDRLVVAGDLRVVDLASGARIEIDTAAVDVTAARWFADSRLGYTGQRGLDSVLGILDMASGRTTEVRSVSRSGGQRYPDAAFAADGTVVVVEDSYRLPHQVVRVARGGDEVLTSVANPGTEYILSVCGRAEEVVWRAPDGLEIQGILARPEGEGPFPLVVNIHGGPVWAFQDSWSMSYPWVPLLVSRGYAVLSPNPRGSGGRGQDFAGRVVGDMGGKDTDDYLSGIDALVARGIVDPARIGLIGGSYGGYMSSWLVTQDQRFAASVPISPVTNWYSQSFTSNVAEWGKAFLQADLEQPGTMAHTRSPVLHASNVRTPCLSIAGALDRCTPPEQAREFHQALTAHGIESTLVIYPQEGHGVRSYSAMTDFLTRVVQWFHRHMPA